MNDLFSRTVTTLALFFSFAGALWTLNPALAQTTQRALTLTVAGQPDQAPLLRINGKSYIDIESLARVLHASVRFQGGQTILTLPGAASGTAVAAPPAKPAQLSGAYLSAAIEALTQIREWRAALVNDVQNSLPIADSVMSPLRRTADSKLQLAIAAATTEQDQQAAALLRNEFNATAQLSDQFVAAHAAATYISPDSLNANPQDQKITGCEQVLLAMASTKQFQDAAACH
ncbi:MAG TPA: hypothetical protein VGU23_05745 [Acidobacteriaceae bacterium]|nr:hypothetical protein [Acidobacteriaceae bacterium]